MFIFFVDYVDGRPLQEPVHAIALGGGQFRLSHSPGFVLGIAAGDEFRLLDKDGKFEVTHRSGNIAVQIFSRTSVDPVIDEVSRAASEIGGVLDGRIERGMVFTVSIQSGFPAIEETFNALVAGHPELEWSFGNVYDPADGVTPLNWWDDAK